MKNCVLSPICLRHQNNLLSKIFIFLGDENVLLSGISEVLTIELEKRLKKIYSETQTNLQHEAHSPRLYFRQHIKSKERKNYLVDSL